MSETILYYKIGGGTIGNVRFGIGGITMEVLEKEIRFSMPDFLFRKKTHVLKQEEIMRVSLFTSLFCWGIKIHHSNSEVPSNIGFFVWSRKERERMIDVLKSLSYDVKNFG